MAEIVRFPIIPKLRADNAVERIRRARAALEADEYFVRCAAKSQMFAKDGDFAAAVAQIEGLICFELDSDVAIELRSGQLELAVWLTTGSGFSVFGV
jgi:hypothetical protein